MNMRLTLKQISYFLAAAEEENFRRAARRLHVSQPPLSKQIRQLEEALGVELFTRAAGRVRLTAAGRQLKESGARLMMQLQRAVEDTRRAARGSRGRLRIGLTDDYLLSNVGRVVAEYQSRFPDVIVETHIGLTADLAEEVAHRETDIAFVCPPLPTFAENLAVRTLEPTHIVALVRAGHAVAGQQSVALEELREERFIMVPQLHSTGYFARLGRMFHDAGFAPHVVHECVSPAMTVNLVAEGLGVALIGEHSIQGLDSRVAALPLEGTRDTVERAAIWYEDNQSPQLRELINFAVGATD